MNQDLQPYSDYKKVCSPWLEYVPEHWEQKRLKFLVRSVNEQTFDKEPDELYIALEHVESWTGRVKRANEELAFDSVVKRFRDNDILFGKLRPYLAKVVRPQEPGVCVGEFLVLRVVDTAICPELLEQVLRSKDFIDLINSSTYGAKMPRANWTFIGDQMIAYPSESTEQSTIVNFLRRFDARVARFIRNRRRLMEVLNEQKEYIVAKAVTHGLDPDVPVRPSGIDWLGDIPEHWEIVPLKRVLRKLIDCEHKTAPATEDSAYSVIRTSAVRSGRLRWEGTYCTTAEAFAHWTKRGCPEAGDVIFTREAPAGEACLVPEGRAVCLGQRTVLLKPKMDKYDPVFLIHMIYGGPPRDRIRLLTQGSTVGHFNMDDIGWMPVLKPPLKEQQLIVSAIASQTAEIDESIIMAESEIGMIREYRTRLIADVVAGKIDVRGLAKADFDGVIEDELCELDWASDADEILEDEEGQLVEEAVDAGD